ncbi:MAG: S1 RNA-binding domain-containing protein [Ruminococcus sp.]|nr:S1 RNA-binding domain-containing protein [Ruminococcus sp.]
MQLEVGKIYEGKVTGITKFGAFVELDKDTTGMVHISEVANSFVSEIKEFLQEGQPVKVKVMSIGDDGKIALSIKKALPAPPKKPRFDNTKNQNKGGYTKKPFNRENSQPQDFMKNPPPVFDNSQGSGNADFEDMLSKFKATSEERFSDLKHVIDNKRKSQSRRK